MPDLSTEPLKAKERELGLGSALVGLNMFPESGYSVWGWSHRF